jgi:predicted nucleic acid-binding protein
VVWVVDTCVVIDVLVHDPEFGLRSATLLEERLSEGLGICLVTQVELAPAFDGDFEAQKRFLDLAGISDGLGWPLMAAKAAHAGWHSHVIARRSGECSKRPVADVLIGACAATQRGLITRNGSDFRRRFPNLQILEP